MGRLVHKAVLYFFCGTQRPPPLLLPASHQEADHARSPNSWAHRHEWVQEGGREPTVEMISGVACLDRADPLDRQESRQEQTLAKAETQDTPEPSEPILC